MYLLGVVFFAVATHTLSVVFTRGNIAIDIEDFCSYLSQEEALAILLNVGSRLPLNRSF